VIGIQPTRSCKIGRHFGDMQENSESRGTGALAALTPMTASSLSHLWRFAAALAVAFVASLVSVGMGSVGMGFAGVFLGSLCLARSGRVIGSLLLVLCGSAFYLQFWIRAQIQLNRTEWADMTFPLLPGLIVGGVMASAVLAVPAWWTRASKHHQQDPPTKSHQP
jgi:hypothetical protein